MPFVEVLAVAARRGVVARTNSQCLVFGEPPAVAVGPVPSCDDATARDRALVASGRFRYVVIAERWIGYPHEALDRIDAELDAIVAAGAIPVLAESIAEDGSDPRDCFYRRVGRRDLAKADCRIARDNGFLADNKAFIAALVERSRRRYPTLIHLDLRAVQCRDGRCDTLLDATPIYVDTHHLAPFGATLLAHAWLARFGNPFGGPTAPPPLPRSMPPSTPQSVPPSPLPSSPPPTPQSTPPSTADGKLRTLPSRSTR